MNYKEVQFLFENLGMTYKEISIYLDVNKSVIRKIDKRHKFNNLNSRKRKRIIERAKIKLSFDKIKNNVFNKTTGNLTDLFAQYGTFENKIISINFKLFTNFKKSFEISKWIKKDLHICNKLIENNIYLTEKSSVKFARLIFPYYYLFNNPVETLKTIINCE